MDTSIDAFSHYLTTVRAKATRDKYVAAATQFLKVMSHNGYSSFEDLPRNLLDTYVRTLTEQGYKPTSVSVYLAGVRKYLGWVENQGVEIPRMAKPDMPRIYTEMRSALPPDALRRYFEVADELPEPARTAIMLLPCTGLRASEMAALPLSAIRPVFVDIGDEKRRTIALLVAGKGGRQRHVPMIEEGVEILTSYLMGYRRKRQGPWVFPGKRTKKNRRGAYHMTSRALRGGIIHVREGLNMDFTAHTMRRTYLTSLYRRGVAVATLAKIAGHANIQTLFKHYLALDDHDVALAVATHGENLYS